MLYPASVTFIPERVIKDFKRMICKFIWGSEVNKVAYYTICLPVEQGGLKLLDLKSLIQSAHLSWIRRLCRWDCQKWTLIPRLILGAQSTLFRFFLEKKRDRLKTIFNPFYKEILQTWLDVYYRLPVTEEERQNESLWNNDFITCGGKNMNWRKCDMAGVVQIKDFLRIDTGCLAPISDILNSILTKVARV